MRSGLGTMLRRLVALLDGDVERVYGNAGLDFRARYYPVFQALSREEACTIRAIALQSGLTHSALSQTITEMRKAGLVTVTPGEDARERNVELSPKGKLVMAELQPYWEAIAAAADALDAELDGSLFRALEGAADALEQRSFYDRIEAERAARIAKRTRKKKET
ncbi:MarR family transcriptional regulator [Pendulispora rubella]|uniref:MarR family transcriptional regulator n=1 Tax=Pendulispora rubella TaxID=2741070 RepID=A0ABZ2KPM4_9BACT